MSEQKPVPRANTKLTIKPLPMIPKRKTSDSPIPKPDSQGSPLPSASQESSLPVNNPNVVNTNESIRKTSVKFEEITQEPKNETFSEPELEKMNCSVSNQRNIDKISSSNPVISLTSSNNRERVVSLDQDDTSPFILVESTNDPQSLEMSEGQLLNTLDGAILGGFKPRNRRNVVRPISQNIPQNSSVPIRESVRYDIEEHESLQNTGFEEVPLEQKSSILKITKKKKSIKAVDYLDEYISHIRDIPRRTRRIETPDLLQDLIILIKDDTPSHVYKLISVEDFLKVKYFKNPKK